MSVVTINVTGLTISGVRDAVRRDDRTAGLRRRFARAVVGASGRRSTARSSDLRRWCESSSPTR